MSIPEGITASDLSALTACLGDVAGQGAWAGDVPAIAPALLLGHPVLAPYATLMRPSKGMGLVHESQSFQCVGGLAPATPLTIEAALSQKGAARVFDFDLMNAEQCRLGSMQTRLRTVMPEDMARFKGSAFPPHMDKGNVLWSRSAPFGAAAVDRYLALACDPNPIHVSDEAAQAVGLKAAVVPGMFFAGVIEPVLAQHLPEVALRQVKLRFMAPVAVGEVLDYGVLTRAVDAAGHAKSVRVFIVRCDKVIAAIADLEMSPKDQAT